MAYEVFHDMNFKSSGALRCKISSTEKLMDMMFFSQLKKKKNEPGVKYQVHALEEIENGPILGTSMSKFSQGFNP